MTEVHEFLEAESLTAQLDDLLSLYDALRHIANRIRDQTTFHYPYDRGQRAVVRTLRQIADQDEYTGSYGPSSKIRHSRQLFADQVVAMLVVNACGGTMQAYETARDDLQEAVASLGRFANAVLDAYLVRHFPALQNVHPVDVPPERLP